MPTMGLKSGKMIKITQDEYEEYYKKVSLSNARINKIKSCGVALGFEVVEFVSPEDPGDGIGITTKGRKPGGGRRKVEPKPKQKAQQKKPAPTPEKDLDPDAEGPKHTPMVPTLPPINPYTK